MLKFFFDASKNKQYGTLLSTLIELQVQSLNELGPNDLVQIPLVMGHYV